MTSPTIEWPRPFPALLVDRDQIQVPVSVSPWRVRELAVLDLLSRVRPNLFFAMLFLGVSAYLVLTNEPGTQAYNNGIYLGVGVVGIKFGFMLLINIASVAATSTGPNTKFRLSVEGVQRIEDGKVVDQIAISEIRKCQIRRVRYLRGSRHFLRVRRLGRKWHELEFPVHLKPDIESFLQFHSIQYSYAVSRM